MKADSSEGIFSLIEITCITGIPSVLPEYVVCVKTLQKPKVAGAKRIIALMLCHRSGRLEPERRASYVTRLGRRTDF